MNALAGRGDAEPRPPATDLRLNLLHIAVSRRGFIARAGRDDASDGFVLDAALRARSRILLRDQVLQEPAQAVDVALAQPLSPTVLLLGRDVPPVGHRGD